MLLHADDGAIDQTIAQALPIGTATVKCIRKHSIAGGLTTALRERPRPGGKRKLDGTAEATLVAWACSTPPDDRARWTMQLLADKLVELNLADSVSDETVRRTLKNDLKPWRKVHWLPAS